MRKVLLCLAVVLFISGCSTARKSIPLNKGAFKQVNLFDINEMLNSQYAKSQIKDLDKVRLEFGSNEQNKRVIKSGVKVQRYATASFDGELIKDACEEAFVAIIGRYVKEAVKRNADIVNIASNWRGNTEYLKDKFVCMSSDVSVGVMMKADIAQK